MMREVTEEGVGETSEPENEAVEMDNGNAIMDGTVVCKLRNGRSMKRHSLVERRWHMIGRGGSMRPGVSG